MQWALVSDIALTILQAVNVVINDSSVISVEVIIVKPIQNFIVKCEDVESARRISLVMGDELNNTLSSVLKSRERKIMLDEYLPVMYCFNSFPSSIALVM